MKRTHKPFTTGRWVCCLMHLGHTLWRLSAMPLVGVLSVLVFNSVLFSAQLSAQELTLKEVAETAERSESIGHTYKTKVDDPSELQSTPLSLLAAGTSPHCCGG